MFDSPRFPLCLRSLVHCVFLYCSLVTRCLHSLPTRRSSDLVETTEAKAKAVKPVIDKMITLGKRGDMHAPLAQRNHQDRKSTRLNSSHVAILYAVFCLKKKNT